MKVEEFPTVGVPIQITEVADGELVVTYQPDAPIAQSESLTVAGQSVSWTPKKAGIVTLQAADGSKVERSVKFDGVPASGIAICLIAAVVLLGGATWSLRQLLGGKEG